MRPIAAGIVSHSEKMRLFLRRLLAIAQSDKPAMLLGANGTGRRYFAGRLHDLSRRKDKPLVHISGLAPLDQPSLLEHAERARGGTLVVADLDGLDHEAQRNLLCLLAKLGEWKQRPRILSTALPDLKVLTTTGRFNRSLYHRLSVLMLAIPALRERREDLPGLCDLLLKEHAESEGREGQEMTPEGVAALRSYSWPGNVRELSNILLSALLMAPGPIDGDAISLVLSTETSSDEIRFPVGLSLREAVQALVLATLRSNNGNKQSTAKQLGITRRTLYQKLARIEEMQ
jgi:DNA-binding NtrC family response regulator